VLEFVMGEMSGVEKEVVFEAETCVNILLSITKFQKDKHQITKFYRLAHVESFNEIHVRARSI
jgi:hypothetical protein